MLIIKLIVRVFGNSMFIGIYMYDLLFILGLCGMLFASVAALRQEDVKRMVAYSSSAQISYIFLALGLGSRAGVAAACFQILAHAFTKPMIFVGAGALIRVGRGGHYWSDLRGAAWKDPMAGLAFTVGGLSLCGLPLLAGFSAKYGLAVAALAVDWQTMPALFGLAASSVLNAMYYIPAILALLVASASLGSILGTIYFKWKWAATILLVVVFGACGGVGGFSIAGGGEDVAQLIGKGAAMLAEFPWWVALAAAASLGVDAAFQWVLLRKQEVKL